MILFDALGDRITAAKELVINKELVMFVYVLYVNSRQ